MANLTELSLPEAVAVLTRTPTALDALLRGLPDIWVLGNEGKDTWSPFVIVGHLIVGERTDWLPRVRIILEHGEARPFDPFDRFAQNAVKDKTFGTASRRIRSPAERESGWVGGVEFTTRRLEPEGKTSGAWGS